jgi:hypothetical protein
MDVMAQSAKALERIDDDALVASLEEMPALVAKPVEAG